MRTRFGRDDFTLDAAAARRVETDDPALGPSNLTRVRSAVTGREGESGRMIGGLIGGTMVELPALGEVPRYADRPHIGYTNMSLRGADADAAYAQLQAFDGLRCLRPVDIGGVRMLFVHDPDDTPIELVELPGGAATTDRLWCPPAG